MSEHELWNELGNLYFLSGAYPQAVHAYNRSIQLDEGFGRPYSNLALTYVQQGKFDEAVDLYRRSIELLIENKEKAISWNRLGNVYRYLKDYKQAVVAYQRADELDPENGEGRDEPGWLSNPANEGPAENRSRQPASDTASASASTEHDSLSKSLAELFPEVEPEEKSTATWAVPDSTAYQQDISEAFDPSSLTTWGDPSHEDDDFEADWPPDPETEVLIPDIEGDDLTKWLPIPDEQPQDAWEADVDDGSAEPEEPQEYGPEPEIVYAAAEAPAESEQQPSVRTEEPVGVEITALLPETCSAQMTHGDPEESKQEPQLDVIVQERPASEFVLASGPEEASLTEQPPQQEEPESAPASISNPETVGMPLASVRVPERDPDEIREFEAGIAKFKRVVQINPRNAHAWDSLGNLYKAAGLYKEALLAYQQAISNDPSKALYHHHLGLVYACEGRTEDAIDAFQRVIEIDPDHGLAHAALGGYYRKMGLEELAQKHVGKAMKSIFDSENEYNRACLAAICGNTDQALELLRVALMNKQTYVDWILRDPDLDFIRQDPRFKQLISDYAI